LGRHPLPAHHVVAHSDIAPDRKQDPGELFDWEGLAANGVGFWPFGVAGEGAERPTGGMQQAAALLARIGYPVDSAQPQVALTAFQRRFRQERVDGVADSGTLARLEAVLRLSEQSDRPSSRAG
jgi:N-acetylmuramoyl-L-alanine amidase